MLFLHFVTCVFSSLFSTFCNVSFLLFFPETFANWRGNLLVWSSHSLILFLLFSLFVILLGILGNFLDLGFSFVELLISIHNFNLQNCFLVFQIFLFHIIFFLFQGCDNVFFYLSRGNVSSFWSFTLLSKLYTLSYFSFPFVFGLLSFMLESLVIFGCLRWSVRHWESRHKAFSVWVGLWTSFGVIRQGSGISLGDPCPLTPIQPSGHHQFLLMEMLFRSVVWVSAHL